MQSARGVVRAGTELAACMELGEDHLHTGKAGAGLNVYRDTAALIAYGDATIRTQCDEDLLAVTTKRLIDGIVDNLPQAVHQPPGIGGADVHRWSFPNRLQALENQQMPRLIDTAFRCGAGSWHGLRVPRTRRQTGAKAANPALCLRTKSS